MYLEVFLLDQSNSHEFKYRTDSLIDIFVKRECRIPQFLNRLQTLKVSALLRKKLREKGGR